MSNILSAGFMDSAPMVRVLGPADRRSANSSTPVLSLSHIDRSFPRHWLEYSPSPIHSYIEHTERRLIELGALSENDVAFRGYCGVPRYFHPRADGDALSLSLELICWYFTFDEPFDQGWLGGVGHPSGRSEVDRMLQVLELGRLPTDPSSCERLCYSFLDRARNIGGGNTPAWVRFRDRCAAWVKSILPLNRRVRHSHLELAEYNELRLANVGIVAEYALNEIIAGLDLDESFVADPMVVRYGDLAALIIAYCNDIYSYERETIQCTQFNSVELRCSNHGLSLHEAFFAQVEDIRAMVAEMVAIEDQLHSTGVLGYSQPNEEPGAARRRRHQTIYMEDIRAIVVGNHQWSLNDGRYDSLSSPFEELHHRAFLRRQDSETTAIPRY